MISYGVIPSVFEVQIVQNTQHHLGRQIGRWVAVAQVGRCGVPVSLSLCFSVSLSLSLCLCLCFPRRPDT